MPDTLSTDRRRVFGPGGVGDYLVAAWVVLILGVWLYTRINSQTNAEDPQHPPGQHGGVLIPFAHDRYHAEALIETGGLLRLFILGRDQTEVVVVPEQSLAAYVNSGEQEVTPISLVPVPQPGDRPEHTSQFVGQIPAEWEGRPLSLTVSSLRIGGSRYRLAFTWEDQHESDMPEKLKDGAEQQLYLVAGGGYTESDIEANGGLTPSQKYPHFQARHDAAPQVGDRLCPISRTKANPECTWTIGGREYQFCCPPCVDEFVELAKTHPDKIQSPESYVQ